MPTYITLVKLTDQGVRNLKTLPERVQEAMQTAAQFGVHFTPYMTIGPYDFVGVANAPDDETIARVNLTIAIEGDVRTITMRAFEAEEIQRIISGVP